jgi:hypothetical protein
LGIKLTDSKKREAWIFSIAPGTTKLNYFDGWISEGYGIRQPGSVACFELSEPNHKMVIILPGEESGVFTRIDNSLKKEKLFLNRRQLFMA